MNTVREHSSRIVFVRFLEGEYWEEWNLRFNQGSKQNKPVKFFAERSWKSDYTKNICPFSGTHFDYASVKDAEESFEQEMKNIGGVLVQQTKQLAKELKERFGYVSRNDNQRSQ